MRIYSNIRDEKIRNGWSYATNSKQLECYMSRIIITKQLTYFQKSSLSVTLKFASSENKNSNS